MSDGPNLRITIDGRALEVALGTSVAAALLNAGILGVRRSVAGRPRGPVCGMGTCFECRVTIDGQQHVRSCNVVCADGMHIETADA